MSYHAEKVRHRKLAEYVERIRMEYERGAGVCALARRYGVAHKSIQQVIWRDSYPNGTSLR